MNSTSVATQHIRHVAGANFSGRSAFLRRLVKAETAAPAEGPTGVMIGAIPANYISGLAPTIADEIALHTAGNNTEYDKRLRRLLADFGFEKHFQKNPFQLSGGEQALLSVVCGLLLEPKHLAIDTTLEQLNSSWRTPLLATLSDSNFHPTKISIADNRFSEYAIDTPIITPYLENPSQQADGERFPVINCPDNIPVTREAQNLLLDGLSFGYTKKQMLLHNLSYEFEAGHIYHIHGTNGAGKSTFSKLLAGVLKPSSGNIIMGSHRYDAYRFPGKSVGYSFQNPDEQIFSNTVKDEILPRSILRKNGNPAFAEAVIAAFGLERFSDRHPSELPFVMRKRIALAATIANERDWYIFDEPTIGQDQENVAALAKLIRLLADKGKGIIVVSHSDQFVASFEEMKTVSLREGRISE